MAASRGMPFRTASLARLHLGSWPLTKQLWHPALMATALDELEGVAWAKRRKLLVG